MTPSDESGAARCSDGIDNDLDSLIDCADPSCLGSSACAQSAPLLSPVFLALALTSLVVAGLIGLRRRLG